MVAAPSILFVHDSYPGQFGHLARFLHASGWDVSFATGSKNVGTSAPWPVIRFRQHREPTPQTHPYAQHFERAVLAGQACLRALSEFGFKSPDIVLSHTGTGPGLYMREAFPKAHIVAYCEWWYQAPGPDAVCLAKLRGAELATDPERRVLARARNAGIAMELLSADRGLCPTDFQCSQFPDALRTKLTVRHDGVDTDFFAPGPAKSSIGSILAHVPFVTYATRGMEPYRGFPQIITGLKAFLDEHPSYHAVIAGENRVFYGSDQDRNIDWQAWALSALGSVRKRVHFVGRLNIEDYRALLRQTRAHIYATVPFVLSWSLLEAMATAAPVVVSNTDPVLEVAGPKEAAVFELENPLSLGRALAETVATPELAARRAQAARKKIVQSYSHHYLMPEHLAWLKKEIMA